MQRSKWLIDKFTLSKVGIFTIMAIYMFTRIMGLGELPWAMTNDEVATGYEAYSILKTAKDQWGSFLPWAEFKGFGDYRLPLYIYLTVPFMALLGLNPMAVRLVSMFSGLIVIWMVYRIVSNISRRAGLIAALILSFTPWFFGLTRFAIESPLALALVLTAVDQIIKNRINAYRWQRDTLAAVCLLMSLFSYPGVRLFLPVLLLLLIVFRVINRWPRIFFQAKRLLAGRKLYPISLVVVIVFVLMLWFASTIKVGGGARLRQVGFFSNQDGMVILDLANAHLTSCKQTGLSLFCRLTNNRFIYMADSFLRNYLNHFSLSYLFLDQNMNSGFIPRGGLLLVSTIPGLLVGVLFLYRQPELKKWALFYLTWTLAAIFPSSLTGGGHYSRAFFMLFPLAALAGIGMDRLITKNRKMGYLCLMLLFLQIGKFLLDYATYFPVHHSRYMQFEYRQVMEYLKSVPDIKSKDVYMSNRYFDTKQYVFYLFYFKIDPLEYQDKIDKTWNMEKNGWINMERVGRWHFVNGISDWENLAEGDIVIGSYSKEMRPINDLNLDDCPFGRLVILNRFFYPDGGEAMAVAQWQKYKNYEERICKRGK